MTVVAHDVDDELRAANAALRQARAEVAALSRRLDEDRVLGMAIGMVAERLKVSERDAEHALRAIAATDRRSVLELADELVRTRRLH